MAIVPLVAFFFARKLNCFCVDHDDEITQVDVRTEAGFVLTAQYISDFRRHPTQDLPLGIHHEPLALGQ
jgi:hypothetical protein